MNEENVLCPFWKKENQIFLGKSVKICQIFIHGGKKKNSNNDVEERNISNKTERKIS